jgi:allantoate deiminase
LSTKSRDASSYAPGEKLMARLDAFARYSDEDDRLTRLYLSKAHGKAAKQYIEWCHAIGLAATIDAVGNVRARYEGKKPGAPILMLGSHIDTVRNAGRFDGNLGALAPLSVVEQLVKRDERLDVAIEIVAFGDEEGVRFPTNLAGSRALAGLFTPSALDQRDAEGITMREALVSFGCEPEKIAGLRARNVVGFVELHIEQGPVLESENLPVGVVTAINGATRLHASVLGVAGHSGAVPMSLRRDALAASAEMILAIEERAGLEADLVATVGRVEVEAAAANVIPGETRFTVDVRAPHDQQRHRAVADISRRLTAVAERRRVTLSLTQTHDAPAYTCDPEIVAGLSGAVQRIGQTVRRLPSGAGHDAMIMGSLCPAGMLFLRCKGGVSHNPVESITIEDCEIGLEALTEFVRCFTWPRAAQV